MLENATFMKYFSALGFLLTRAFAEWRPRRSNQERSQIVGLEVFTNGTLFLSFHYR